MSERKDSVAAEARRDFASWVGRAESGRVFGEVRVISVPDGYVVRHRDDEAHDATEIYTDPREAREISRLTEAGDYRPLKSSPNLRRGWRLDISGDRGLMIAMNYLYPAAVTHWHQERGGRLRVTNFRENAGRQSGIYERIKHLSDAAAQNATAACCEDSVCLKRTLWDIDEETPIAMERGGGEIPCPEPCSVFVAFARKVRSFEREDVYAADDANGLAPSEKKDVATLVETVAEGEINLAREAEFDEPLNVRRMRYRRLTLTKKLEAGEED